MEPGGRNHLSSELKQASNKARRWREMEEMWLFAAFVLTFAAAFRRIMYEDEVEICEFGCQMSRLENCFV